MLLKYRAGPVGFDPMTCGSEDRRDILTTLRTLLIFVWYVSCWQLYNLLRFNFIEFIWLHRFVGRFTILLLFDDSLSRELMLLETVYSFFICCIQFLVWVIMKITSITIHTYFLKRTTRTSSDVASVKTFMTRWTSGQLHTIKRLLFDLYVNGLSIKHELNSNSYVKLDTKE